MPDGISLGDAIKRFLKKSRMDSRMHSFRVADIWEEIMGKTIARYTDKVELVQHTLFISTSVAPLRQELMYQKNQIRQRVNEALGEPVVQDVVIR